MRRWKWQRPARLAHGVSPPIELSGLLAVSSALCCLDGSGRMRQGILPILEDHCNPQQLLSRSALCGFLGMSGVLLGRLLQERGITPQKTIVLKVVESPPWSTKCSRGYATDMRFC